MFVGEGIVLVGGIRELGPGIGGGGEEDVGEWGSGCA